MPVSLRGRLARTSWILALAVLIGCSAQPAFAQATPPPTTSISQDLPTADFMFGRPRATVGVRGAWAMPTGGSDLFDFIQDQLTIDSGDFNGPAFAFDVGVPVGSRMDVVVGYEFARGTVNSEYRDLVDNNELPIQQESSLRQNSLTGSVRFLLVPRGRSVGKFAWVPSRLTPYAGAGGGLLWWKFQQRGDFVDFQDMGVFTDVFTSNGTTPSGHVFGGMDIQAYKRLLISFEGRYIWASDALGPDFIDFEPIDLSGFRFSTGINILF